MPEIPGVPGVFSPDQCCQTAESIAATQEPSGAIPWSHGGHTDPWDHIENAMALTVAGLLEPARAAFDWSLRTQRDDGTWPIQLRNGVIEDANSDSNFCAYIATGVWHHVLVTGDRRFAETMWPVVVKAIDFVLSLQSGTGEIAWAASPSGIAEEALLTGCASIRGEGGQPTEGGLGRVVGDAGLEADLDRDLRRWGEHDVIIEQALVGNAMFDDRVREQVAERIEQLGAGERSAHHVSSDATHALDLDVMVVRELAAHTLAACVLKAGQHPRGHLDAVDRCGAHPSPRNKRDDGRPSMKRLGP